MPTTYLIEPSSIDHGAVAIDAETVGRLNPQCGDMRQLDHLLAISVEEKYCIGIKKVREDEFWVPLHIPGRPLMPGVLMLEAAAQLCSVYRHTRAQDDKFVGFTRIDDTVFRGQVVPGDTLILTMLERKFTPRRFISACQGLVGDQIVFDATITGMVM